MIDQPDAKLLQALFAERSQYIPFSIAEHDSPSGSRVGGRPPAILQSEALSCPRCGGSMLYILTLQPDIVPLLGPDQALSLLCCSDLACRMQSCALIEPASVICLLHAQSPRATGKSSLDSDFEARGLLAAPASADVETDLSKIGGAPWYIQGEAEEDEAAAGQRVFIGKWSENSYLRTMKRGSYPFLFGEVYLFGAISWAAQPARLQEVVAFWQCS